MIIVDVDPWFAGATGAALIALIVTGLVLRDAFLDLRHVQALGIGNGRLRIARSEVRFEARRVLVVAFLAAASGAATYLTVGAQARAESWVGLVPRLAILGATITIVVDAVSGLRYRAWLRETYHPGHPAAATVADEDTVAVGEEDHHGL